MKTAIGVIAVLLIAIVAWWFLAQAPAPIDTPNTTDTATTTDTTAGNASGIDVGVDVDVDTTPTAPTSVAVTYGANGFSPATVTIKKGGVVTWSNTGGTSMWVASAQHPTHTAYAGTSLQEHCDDATDTSFDQCKNGSSYSFTFTQVGTWNYHNHSNSSQFGKVIVVE